MKQTLTIALLVVGILSLTATSHADRYTRGTNDNPARIVGYVVNPIGIALEYVVMRPIHWVVSQSCCDIIFGHEVGKDEAGTYFEWVNGDFQPSIADERAAEKKPEAKPMKTAESKKK